MPRLQVLEPYPRRIACRHGDGQHPFVAAVLYAALEQVRDLGASHYASRSHVDQRYHENPERFDPDRWMAEYAKALPRFAYFPFGGGPRQCTGAGFAMTEVSLFLTTVAHQFRMDLAPGQSVEPYPSITLRPKAGIRTSLVEHSRGG